MANLSRGMDNLNLRSFIGVGDWDIPEVKSCKEIHATEFIPFNSAKTEKNPSNKGILTFVDDYQIDRIWNYPERYIEMFKRFDCVMSPDYSLYTDYPLAMQMWAHYKKMWITAYMQEYGVNMIPVACWSDERSFDFCFDGMPLADSIIAVSNVGCIKGDRQKYYFQEGYRKMLKEIAPKHILFYGQPPEWMDMSNVTLIGKPHDRFSSVDSYTDGEGDEEWVEEEVQ